MNTFLEAVGRVRTINSSLEAVGQVKTMNSSLEVEDVWWQDENYERRGEPIDPFISWLQRNALCLILALLGTSIAATWFIKTIKVFPNEIRDLYSSLKVYLSRIFSSWWRTIRRKKNRLRTRCCYKARPLQKDKESRVRFEVEKRTTQPNKQKTTTLQSRGFQKQNCSRRRTKIMIIDDIYGEIVGYQDSDGPAHQGKEYPRSKCSAVQGQKYVSVKPSANPVNHNNYRMGHKSLDSVEMQPRCHVKVESLKSIMEGKVAERPRLNDEADKNARFAERMEKRASRSCRTSTPASQITLEMIRMRESAYRIRRERESAARARQFRAMKAKQEQKQDEDLVEYTV